MRDVGRDKRTLDLAKIVYLTFPLAFPGESSMSLRDSSRVCVRLSLGVEEMHMEIAKQKQMRVLRITVAVEYWPSDRRH